MHIQLLRFIYRRSARIVFENMCEYSKYKLIEVFLKQMKNPKQQMKDILHDYPNVTTIKSIDISICST